MRAVSDDPELAAVSGLEVEKVVRATWIIGASLAAVGGVLAGMDTDVHSNLGWNLLLPMFAAALLGGIGKPMGALAGGLIIGLVEELSTYPWIGDDPLVSPSYKTAVAFLVMVVILVFRPQGIFKGRLF
jgi:branched-chain amino acid transport system permease protein